MVPMRVLAHSRQIPIPSHPSSNTYAGVFFVWQMGVLHSRVCSLVGYFSFIYLFIYLFIISKFCGRWSGHHPQEDLAKFGYMSVRKVEKFRNPAIFWWHIVIWQFQKTIPHTQWLCPIFFPNIAFVWVALDFFFNFVVKMWNFTLKTKALLHPFCK
jgi:hypothetical protein